MQEPGWHRRRRKGQQPGAVLRRRRRERYGVTCTSPRAPKLFGSNRLSLGVRVENTRRKICRKVNRAEVPVRKQIPGVFNWGGDEKNVNDWPPLPSLCW